MLFRAVGDNTATRTGQVSQKSHKRDRWCIEINVSEVNRLQNRALDVQNLRTLKECASSLGITNLETDRATAVYLEFLYINSVYCGGSDADADSYNPCSHKFVALSNIIDRSEEHTSEVQSHSELSYVFFCFKKTIS